MKWIMKLRRRLGWTALLKRCTGCGWYWAAEGPGEIWRDECPCGGTFEFFRARPKAITREEYRADTGALA